MGKKNANNQNSASMPVDQYRKQIGKQDHKKAKKEMKEVRRRAEAKKSAMGVPEIALMAVAFIGIMGAVYFFLYIYLQKEERSKVIKES